MYGGGGTPITDDESDEDQLSTSGSNAGAYGGYSSQNQGSNYGDYSGGGAGGGFTETVLDDNNDHDDAMSGGGGGVVGGSTVNAGPFDDNDVDHNDNGGESENWVNIDYEGQSFRVPISDRVRTFAYVHFVLSLSLSLHGDDRPLSDHSKGTLSGISWSINMRGRLRLRLRRRTTSWTL